MDSAALLALAIAMAGYSAYQVIRAHRNIAFIMFLFWSMLGWRIMAPQPWQIAALVVLLLLHFGLRFSQVWQARVDLAIGKIFLRPLSREERRYRTGLSPNDRCTIEVREWISGKRLTEEESEDVLRRERERALNAEREEAKERQEMLEKALERQREEAERRSLEVTPVSEPLRVRFHLSAPRDFATTRGTRLVVPAGEHTGELVLRLLESCEPDDGYDAPVEVEFTFFGKDGNRWQCAGVLSTSYPLDIWRIAKAEPSAGIHFWEDVDIGFRQSFQERCILAGLEVFDDCRNRFPLRIGERVAIIFTKYCGWKVDLALDKGERLIWVRVSQLTSEIWEGDPFGKEGKTAEWKGLDRLPAFVYPLLIEQFLPLTHPERFASSVDDGRRVYWDGDGSDLVFTRLQN